MSYPINQAITYAATPATNGYLVGDHTVSWAFDDGTTANGLTTNKTWSTSGLKTAIATATNTITGALATDGKTINIMTYLWNPLAGMPSSVNVLGPGVYGVQGNKMLITSGTALVTYVYDFSSNAWSIGPALNYTAIISDSSGQGYRQAPIMPNGDVYLQQIGFGAPQSVNITTGVVTNLVSQGTYSISNYAVMGGDGNVYYFCLGGSFNRTYVHNLTDNTWSLKATLSPAIFGLAPIYAGNNKIFMIERDAGYGWTYDYSNDTWLRSTNVSGLSTPGTNATSTQILMPDGRIFGTGGTNQKGAFYNQATNTFTVTTNTDPITRDCPGLFLMENGEIHIVGGISPSTVSSTIFNPTSGIFSSAYAMGHGRMSNIVVDPITGKPVAFGKASSAAVFTSIFDGL